MCVGGECCLEMTSFIWLNLLQEQRVLFAVWSCEEESAVFTGNGKGASGGIRESNDSLLRGISIRLKVPSQPSSHLMSSYRGGRRR